MEEEQDYISVHKRGITFRKENYLISFHNQDKEGNMWLAIDREDNYTYSTIHLKKEEIEAIKNHFNSQK